VIDVINCSQSGKVSLIMKSLIFVVSLLCGISTAEQPPKTMTKIEVILQSPDAPAGSFAAKPKVFYRAGNRYCRIEEAPDPEQGIHSLMIVNEPDYWMVNLLTKTGRHSVDPGPTFNCHLPIFAYGTPQSLDEETKEIRQLEFGQEFEFFKNKGATAEKGPVLQTKNTMVYRAKVGTASIALFTYGTPERPLAVALQREGKNDLFWYSGYGQVDFDPKLFAKPENVKIEDSKP
jgi:hypothetical protein